MAHAAPASGTPRTPGITSGTPGPARRSPDLFDRRTHALGRLAVPLAIGLVYGYWAAANRRQGGPITTWNLVFGFACTVGFTVLCSAFLVMAPRLRRELHAALWGAFTGITLGFLYIQANVSVLHAAGLALLVALAVFLFDFYRYYTHEDAEGHRIA
jgi:Ca2+/Na+ antiporter